jgi:hypothetical protein
MLNSAQKQKVDMQALESDEWMARLLDSSIFIK